MSAKTATKRDKKRKSRVITVFARVWCVICTMNTILLVIIAWLTWPRSFDRPNDIIDNGYIITLVDSPDMIPIQYKIDKSNVQLYQKVNEWVKGNYDYHAWQIGSIAVGEGVVVKTPYAIFDMRVSEEGYGSIAIVRHSSRGLYVRCRLKREDYVIYDLLRDYGRGIPK